MRTSIASWPISEWSARSKSCKWGYLFTTTLFGTGEQITGKLSAESTRTHCCWFVAARLWLDIFGFGTRFLQTCLSKGSWLTLTLIPASIWDCQLRMIADCHCPTNSHCDWFRPIFVCSDCGCSLKQNASLGLDIIRSCSVQLSSRAPQTTRFFVGCFVLYRCSRPKTN